MRRARHNQRDLFDEAIPTPELRAELRSALTPLLQALLMEAAEIPRREPDLQIEEGGNDEDRA
jgi:hypothetical protein